MRFFWPRYSALCVFASGLLAAGMAAQAAEVPMASAPLPPAHPLPPPASAGAPASPAAAKPTIRFGAPAAPSGDALPSNNAEAAASPAAPHHPRSARRGRQAAIRFGHKRPAEQAAARAVAQPPTQQGSPPAKPAEHAAAAPAEKHPAPIDQVIAAALKNEKTRPPAPETEAAHRAPTPAEGSAVPDTRPSAKPAEHAAAAPVEKHPAPIDQGTAAARQNARTPAAGPETEPWHRVRVAPAPDERQAAQDASPPAAWRDRDLPPAAEPPEWRRRPMPEDALPYPPPRYPREAALEARRLRQRVVPGMAVPPPYPPRAALGYPPPPRFPWPW